MDGIKEIDFKQCIDCSTYELVEPPCGGIKLLFYLFTNYKMDIYEKFAILSSLNEDLKEFQTKENYEQTKNLIEENQKSLRAFEKKIEKHSEEVNQKLWEEFQEECESEPEQAKLTYSRRLSDGSLECEFLSPDGETFTKVYTEDEFFCVKSKKYKEKIEKQKEMDEIAFQKFWGLMLFQAHPQKIEKFKALM